jgi:hypothetical protein
VRRAARPADGSRLASRRLAAPSERCCGNRRLKSG